MVFAPFLKTPHGLLQFVLFTCYIAMFVSDSEFQYDAFIIYSTKDEDWIKNTLLTTLEGKHKLKCCIHFRDFIPGAPIRSNMVDSVYKSRKTIAVVSHNFFSSNNCNNELDFALHRLLDKRDDSLVVIKLDDVDGNKLPKALKQRSYIDYPKSKGKQTWEKSLVKCFEVSSVASQGDIAHV